MRPQDKPYRLRWLADYNRGSRGPRRWSCCARNCCGKRPQSASYVWGKLWFGLQSTYAPVPASSTYVNTYGAVTTRRTNRTTT